MHRRCSDLLLAIAKNLENLTTHKAGGTGRLVNRAISAASAEVQTSVVKEESANLEPLAVLELRKFGENGGEFKGLETDFPCLKKQ